MGMLDGILDAVGVGTGGLPWGSIISGASSFLGQESANESNQEIAANNSAFNADQARINRDFNAGEAEKNRYYQENQREDQYQTAVADLKAAGLNPMLAYSQGGSRPTGGAQASGTSAQAVQPAAMQNSAGAGVASALQAAQLDNTRAQTRDTDAAAAIKESEIVGSDPAKNSSTNILKTQQAQESANRQLNITADTTRINKIVEQIGASIGLTQEETKRVTQQILNLKSEQQNIDVNNVLLNSQIPAAKRNAWAAGTTWGKYVTPFLPDLLKGTNSAGSIQRMGK